MRRSAERQPAPERSSRGPRSLRGARRHSPTTGWSSITSSRQPIGTHISLERSYTELAIDKPLRLKYDPVRSVADDAALASVDGRSKLILAALYEAGFLLAPQIGRPFWPAGTNDRNIQRALTRLAEGPRRALPHRRRRRRHPPLRLPAHQGRLRLRKEPARAPRAADAPRRPVARAQGDRSTVRAAQPGRHRLGARVRASRRALRARLARSQPPARAAAGPAGQGGPRVGQSRAAPPHATGEHGHSRRALRKRRGRESPGVRDHRGRRAHRARDPAGKATRRIDVSSRWTAPAVPRRTPRSSTVTTTSSPAGRRCSTAAPRPSKNDRSVVFVCEDGDQALEFLKLADTQVTGAIGVKGTELPEWQHLARERMFFVAERDVHSGTLRAPRLPAHPPEVRATLGESRDVQAEQVSILPRHLLGPRAEAG